MVSFPHTGEEECSGANGCFAIRDIADMVTFITKVFKRVPAENIIEAMNGISKVVEKQLGEMKEETVWSSLPSYTKMLILQFILCCTRLAQERGLPEEEREKMASLLIENLGDIAENLSSADSMMQFRYVYMFHHEVLQGCLAQVESEIEEE